MRNDRNRAVLRTALGLLAVMAAARAGAPAEVRVNGIVHDADGRPIPVAIVTLRAADHEAKAPTDIEGRFQLGWDGPDEVAVEVEAKGFAPRRQALRVSETAGGVTFVLARAAFDEQLTVTGAEARAGMGESPASIVVLTAEELAATPAPVLDDALREVPGFALFRRSGSRVANPTAQGVFLRGLGGSGASRALVLDDGVPLNDPFGGWVYWARVPRGATDRVEVLRGGASNRYGSGALAGVVQLVRQNGGKRRLDVDGSYGSMRTGTASLFAQAAQDRWIMRVSGDALTTGGYVLVEPRVRGRIDTRTTARYLTEEVTLEHATPAGTRLFARGNIYSDERKNGTPLQRNKTEIKLGTLGFDRPGARGGFSVRAYLSDQFYDQTFSVVASDRPSEQPSREQDVPSTASGVLATWNRTFGSRTLTLGVDRSRVSGTTNETVHAGEVTTETSAEGTQKILGLFADHAWGLGSHGAITLGARYDRWTNGDAQRVTGQSVVRLADRKERELSPRASLLLRFSPGFAVTASSYRAFRAPTLNELYRPFRVGDVLTQANEALEAERVRGNEAGVRIGGGRFSLRATAFRMDMEDTIANVTVSTTPTLITRQRRNLGDVRSEGVELDSELRAGNFTFAAGWLRDDATVRAFPADPALVGRRLPQVPRSQGAASIRFRSDGGHTITLVGRWAGSQFDDDRNTLRLGSMRTLDTLVSLPLGGSVDVFFAGENLLGDRWDVGRTPVLTLGPPRAVRAGIRLRLASLPVVQPD